MNTTITTKELKNIIKMAKNNIIKEHRKNQANFVEFSVNNGNITISCYDYNNCVFYANKYINNDNDNNNYIVRLLEIENSVKNLTGKNLNIISSEDSITISDNVFSISLKLQNNIELSRIQEQLFSSGIILNFNDLSDKLKTVFDFISSESNHFAMNGVYFDFLDDINNISIVATDGRRLALNKINICEEQKNTLYTSLYNKNITIHHATIETLLKCVKTSEIQLYVYNNSTIIFNYNNYYIVSNIIVNEFPAYKRVIPENNNYNFTITPDHKLLDPFIKTKIKYNKTSCCIYGNNLFMKQMLENDASIKLNINLLENNNADFFTFSMDASFIIDAIKYAKKEVFVSYKQNGHPYIFKIDSDPNFLAVIMDQNISDEEKEFIQDELKNIIQKNTYTVA